jgi:hypothetical protein
MEKRAVSSRYVQLANLQERPGILEYHPESVLLVLVRIKPTKLCQACKKGNECLHDEVGQAWIVAQVRQHVVS